MISTTDQNVIKSLIICFSHVFRRFRQSQWTCRVVVNQFDIYKTTYYFRAQLICGRYYACGPRVLIYSQNNTPTFPNLFHGMRHVNTQCLGCQSRFWNLSQNNLNLKLKTWTWGSGCSIAAVGLLACGDPLPIQQVCGCGYREAIHQVTIWPANFVAHCWRLCS